MNHRLYRYTSRGKVFYRGDREAPTYSTGDRTDVELAATLFTDEERKTIDQDKIVNWHFERIPG